MIVADDDDGEGEEEGGGEGGGRAWDMEVSCLKSGWIVVCTDQLV
jgi:hypothetical protein